MPERTLDVVRRAKRAERERCVRELAEHLCSNSHVLPHAGPYCPEGLREARRILSPRKEGR